MLKVQGVTEEALTKKMALSGYRRQRARRRERRVSEWETQRSNNRNVQEIDLWTLNRKDRQITVGKGKRVKRVFDLERAVNTGCVGEGYRKNGYTD
jgi:hypothetical protein